MIDFHCSVLAQLFAFDAQMLVTHSLTHLGQCFGARDDFLARLRTKSPEVEQRLDRQVVGAFALL